MPGARKPFCRTRKLTLGFTKKNGKNTDLVCQSGVFIERNCSGKERYHI